MDNKLALDPRRSVVVEACAGSGKTWLLVSRIVRILLDGTPPSQILAITFTRKAAQEMRARLHEWLHDLSIKNEPWIRHFFAERGLETLSDEQLQRARNLYSNVMLAQPGVTISTFHGWFIQVLQRAPLNAEVMQGRQLVERAAALQEEAWESFVEKLRTQAQGVVASHMRDLFEEYGLHNTRALLSSFMAKRAEWLAYTADFIETPATKKSGLSENNLAVEFALQQLQHHLAVDLELDYAAAWGEQNQNGEAVFALAKLLGSGSAAQQNNASKLEMAWTESLVSARFSALWPLVFTQKNEPRSIKANKGQDADAFKLASEVLQASLQAVRDAITEQRTFRLNQALLQCGAALLACYENLKQQRQQMDFADLEWQVCCLLQHSELASTMQYKLDNRYRHVLLDEFQDTNPLQWRIVRAWFDASVAVDSQPSVFLVGDPKQSIYRFRRADARLFSVARDYLLENFHAQQLCENHTRRNSPAILNIVNDVFAEHPDGFDDFENHTAEHKKLDGYVAVLPLAFAEEMLPTSDDQTLTLRNPLTTKRLEKEQSARQQEAECLADKIKEMVGTWQIEIEGTYRLASYNDVMVLVRNRTHLRVYESALREKGIPFLSSRRGGLLDTLEAEDLQALLLFLITPFADLALAQTLRTPIFNCSDEDLLALAVWKMASVDKLETASISWWQRLQNQVALGAASENCQRAYRLLQNWLSCADKLPVHDLLDRIYFEGDVLAHYAAALPEYLRAKVAANLHAFMEKALSIDAGRYPSLPRFLQELRSLRDSSDDAPDEGKMGVVGNAVRIYTVHESKGLEAPIVWLLDANAVNDRRESYEMLLDWPATAERPVHFSAFADLASRGKQRAPLFEADAKQQAREEMNLLYVAMTRAKQVLLVSGHAKNAEAEQQKKNISWYDRIAKVVNAARDNPLRQRPSEGLPANDFKTPSSATMPPNLPPQIAVGQRRDHDTAAQNQGTWLHALLEHLAPVSGWSAGQTGIEKNTLLQRLQIPADACETLWQRAQQLLSDQSLQRFFDANFYGAAYNELAYVNAAGELKRIDRLVEFDTEVWVLDYKFGSPESAARYRPQMLEYQTSMQDIYVGKMIRCALIFHDGTFMEIV